MKSIWKRYRDSWTQKTDDTIHTHIGILIMVLVATLIIVLIAISTTESPKSKAVKILDRHQKLMQTCYEETRNPSCLHSTTISPNYVE